jgi:hypothetical protein
MEKKLNHDQTGSFEGDRSGLTKETEEFEMQFTISSCSEVNIYFTHANPRQYLPHAQPEEMS